MIAWRTLAHHRGLAIVAVASVSLIGRLALLPVLPVPKPAIQDEFSYLLAADTFAHGRLTNPTPPFSVHFETLQVLLRPTYASKYPPVQGLFLALGQKLIGQPWAGVLLATAILSGSICWALQGWLPAPWALAGSIIALFEIGIVSYWTESFWGGTAAALGGALLVGAIPRLIRHPTPLPATLYAAGLAILANTRPYEGLALALACTSYLAYRKALKPLLLPVAVVLIPVAAWMCFYNYRVTGNPLEMPYLAHERQYAVWSPLLWNTQPAPAKTYNNKFLKDFWTKADPHDKLVARQHLIKTRVSDLIDFTRFYLGVPLSICMLLLARHLWRDPTTRTALLLLAAFYAGVAFDTRLLPHYAAPGAILVYILAASAIRVSRDVWRHFPWAILTAVIAIAALGLLTPGNRYLYGAIDYHVRAKRAAAEEQLQRVPGDHVVLVRYGPHHEAYEEFVYNRADIDASRIVWARSLSPRQDAELIRHYASRQVWLLEDDQDFKLSRFTTSEDKGTMITHLGQVVTGRF